MRRCIVVTLLVALFGCIVLSGCGNVEQAYTPEKEWQECLDVQEVMLAYSAREEYPNKTILRWVLPYGACEDNGNEAYREFNRLLDAKGYSFAVDFYVLACDGEEYYRNIRSMKQKGISVDIFNTGFDYFGALFDLCIEDNLCLPWNDFLDTDSGKVLRASKDENIWSALASSGEIYGIAGNPNAPVSEHFTYYFNNRILESYGWDAEELVLDSGKLTEAINTVSEKEQEILPCGLVNMEGIFPFSDYVTVMTPISYSVRENKYVNLTMTETGKSWLSLYAKNAVMPVDISFLQEKDTFFLVAEQRYDLSAPNNDMDGITIVNGPAYNINATGNINCVASWATNSEAAFQLLSAIHTDRELSTVLAYGLEGVNYIEEADGIDTIEPYSLLGDLLLANWGLFRQSDVMEQNGIVVIENIEVRKRLHILECYQELVNVEEIFTDSGPSIQDKKQWNSNTFNDKYASLKKQFERAGGNYLLSCLNQN